MTKVLLPYTYVLSIPQVYVPHILEVIEMSPVNSDLQLSALRLLTNLSVTDQHQHLLKTSIRLLLSLLVVGNEALQVGLLSLRGENGNSFQHFMMQAIICNSCSVWSSYDYSIDSVCISGPVFEGPGKSFI